MAFSIHSSELQEWEEEGEEKGKGEGEEEQWEISRKDRSLDLLTM